MALQELHSSGKIQWPGDARIAVFLSFDFQGGEDVKPDKNGRINHEEYTQGEYGPNTGIWRILRILAAHEVKATFLTCGGIAERLARQLDKFLFPVLPKEGQVVRE